MEAQQALDLKGLPIWQLLFVMSDMEVFFGDGPVRPRHTKESSKRLEERSLA